MKPYKPKVKAPDPHLIAATNDILRQNALTTVCEESACPNRTECYRRGTATFMILGDRCTRACRFCNVKTGRGVPPDPTEPSRVARAVRELGLRYVVITSVDRDDLKDYGSSHFVSVTKALKEAVPNIQIELLTPDFRADESALWQIINAKADKLSHNQETVRRLSATIRPQSDYERSLAVLRYYSKHFKGMIKSSLMVGLGENTKELIETMEDLYEAGVRELCIGQYLQPASHLIPVARYFEPSYFLRLKDIAYKIGFDAVASGVLVRSSYYADRLSKSH